MLMSTFIRTQNIFIIVHSDAESMRIRCKWEESSHLPLPTISFLHNAHELQFANCFLFGRRWSSISWSTDLKRSMPPM